MFRICKQVVTFAVAIVLVGQWAFADEGWLVDFQKAKLQAQQEGKDILMEFTGSDWCPPCKALKEKVLDQEAFKTKAPSQFVLLKLDNPNDKSKQSPEEIEQYKTLSQQFKIQGVPTILLASAEGKPYTRIVGFNAAQSPEDYTQNLIDKKLIRIKREELLAKAESAQGIEKAKLIDEALADAEPAQIAEDYKSQVEVILAADTDNGAGLKEKYETILKNYAIEEAINQLRLSSRGATPEQLVERLDALIEKYSPSGEALQKVIFMKAAATVNSDKPKAKEYLEAAQKLAPNSSLGLQITFILKTQFQDEPKDAGGGKAEKGGKNNAEKNGASKARAK